MVVMSSKSYRTQVSADALKQDLAAAKAARAKDPTDIFAALNLTWSEYMYSMHILEENTLTNAKRLGYLDARELYPDVPQHSLEEYANEFYAMEDPSKVYE